MLDLAWFPCLRVGRFMLVLNLLCVAGCGESSSFVPVEGAVTLNGSPLANANVVFSPPVASAPGPFIATTDAQGKFALGPANEPGGGAAPGDYFLNISTIKPLAGGDETSAAKTPPQREVVPMAYRDGTMKVTIPPEGSSAANFDMKSK